MTDTLSEAELRGLDAYWRAANYLSVGQIYLLDNPLLKQPLKLDRPRARPRRDGRPSEAAPEGQARRAPRPYPAARRGHGGYPRLELDSPRDCLAGGLAFAPAPRGSPPASPAGRRLLR